MKTEQKLGHNSNGELHDGCVGCDEVGKCGGKKSTDLPLPNLRRLRESVKKFECHSLVAEFVARPPNDKETRRRYGETALQY